MAKSVISGDLKGQSNKVPLSSLDRSLLWLRSTSVVFKHVLFYYHSNIRKYENQATGQSIEQPSFKR